ncbi:hypothetical protein [Vibrio alginolyticus]|uniref:hypothetical protein n=1 Tax=Vibrio alginolyticus TaxID=663 RepID=UPI001BD4375D|nr:hypothetical protein [Vibrio alginolyticus]MBS9830301.1 hypothetical protein [Vibrio alginolyticus]
MEFYNWIAVLLGISFVNFCGSVYVATRSELNSFQKVAQIIIIWLIPVIAAIGLYVFHRSQSVSYGPSTEFGGGVNPNLKIKTTGERDEP